MLSLNDSPEVAGPKPTHRSRVSNGSEFLAGIDGRSSTARRMRDIVSDLRVHLGGNPSPAQDIVLRRAATLAAWAEAQEADHCTGKKPLDVQVYLPVVNGLRRLCGDLGLAPAMKDVAPSLHNSFSVQINKTFDPSRRSPQSACKLIEEDTL